MKVSIYTRSKIAGKGWRYRKVKQGRGHRTSELAGPFYLRHAAPDGRQVWEVVGDSLEAATDAAEQRQHALAAAAKGLTVAELDTLTNAARVPIKTACQKFLELKASKAPKTLAAYSLHLDEFQESLHRKTRFLDDITADTLREYRDTMASKGHGGKTQHNRMMTVVFMLKKNGIKNPLAWDEFPTVEVEAAVPFTSEELQKMFAVMSDEEKVRYKFFLGSGAREQEVSFASWSDLDLHKGVFTVRAKPEEGFTPKTHESRSIPLPANLVSILKERKKKPVHSRWVFVNDQGEPERHFLRKLKAVAKRAGLNCGHCTTETTDLNKQQRVEAFTEKFGTDPARFDEYGKQVTLKRTISCSQHPICQHYFLHRFRKTCATRWSEAGVPVRQIQAWLGHKDLTTTMRYLGVGDMHSPQTRSKVDAAFGD